MDGNIVITSRIMFFIYIIFFFIYAGLSIVRFSVKIKKNNAKLLIDKKYVLALILATIVYAILIIDGLVNWNSHPMNNNFIGIFSFMFYLVFVGLGTLKMSLDEGLFAYTQESLIGRVITIDLENLKLIKTNINKFGRRTAKFEILKSHDRMAKNKKILLRLNDENFEILQKAISAKVEGIIASRS